MSMTTQERQWLQEQFTGLQNQIKSVDGKVTTITDDHNKRLPLVERGLADLRVTVYTPGSGLQTKVTVIEDRQANHLKEHDPGNRSERRGNAIALIALLVSLMSMLAMMTQIGGCSMPKKPQEKQLSNLKEVDTLDEYADLKKEITAMVKAIGKDARLELTGDRTYDVEADGTLFMQHSDQRRAVNTWRAEEWGYFREDMAHNRLRQRLQALR